MEYKAISSFRELDQMQFKALVKSGFGRELVSDYFSYAHPKYIWIAIEDGRYCGAIVAEELEPGFIYLDKIVVAKEFQGNGVGKSLWKELLSKAEKLVWRAKPYNPICHFYDAQCDGMQKSGDWNIYWKGLMPAELCSGIGYALSKKPTLEA